MIRNHGHFVLVGIKRAPEGCSFCNTDWWALHSIGKASVHGRCFAVWNRAACSVECIPWTNATQHISCIRLMAWRSPEQQCKTYLRYHKALTGSTNGGANPHSFCYKWGMSKSGKHIFVILCLQGLATLTCLWNGKPYHLHTSISHVPCIKAWNCKEDDKI